MVSDAEGQRLLPRTAGQCQTPHPGRNAGLGTAGTPRDQELGMGRQWYPPHCPQRMDKAASSAGTWDQLPQPEHIPGLGKPQHRECCLNTFPGIVNLLMLVERGREKIPHKGKRTAGTVKGGQGEHPGQKIKHHRSRLLPWAGC